MPEKIIFSIKLLSKEQVLPEEKIFLMAVGKKHRFSETKIVPPAFLCLA